MMEDILPVLIGSSPVLIVVVYLATKLIPILEDFVEGWKADRVLSVSDREKIISLLVQLDGRLDILEGKSPPTADMR